MKTVIQAVNALEAEMSIKNNAVHYNGGFYEGIPDSRYATYICSKEEFNQCVDEMSKAEWMKPAIDWSIAPEDCLGAVHLKDEFTKSGEDYGIFVTKTKGSMEDGYHYCGKKSIGPVMSSHTFTPKPAIEDKITECSCDYCGYDWQCKLSDAQTMACPGCGDKPDVKPVTVPVYTQEFRVIGGNNEVWQKCKIVFKGKRYTVVENESGKEFSRKTSKIIIRDVTPHIELIDGKAYQFNFSSDPDFLKYRDLVGICHTSDKYGTKHVMFESPIGNSRWNSEYCTNIQLLEVKS